MSEITTGESERKDGWKVSASVMGAGKIWKSSGYWGIWIISKQAWLENGDGILYYPAREIAKASLQQMSVMNVEKSDLRVRDFGEPL